MMFDIQVLGSIKELHSFFDLRLKMISNIFAKPYAELANAATEMLKALSMQQSTKWEYIVEPSTGLKLLKSEKDDEAYCRVLKMSTELLQ